MAAVNHSSTPELPVMTKDRMARRTDPRLGDVLQVGLQYIASSSGSPYGVVQLDRGGDPRWDLLELLGWEITEFYTV